MNNTDVRNTVKELGLRLGMSQADIMEAIGKSKTQWEPTLRNPRLDVLWQLAQVLHCPVARIIGEASDDSRPETSGIIECPNCHIAIELKAKEKPLKK